MASPAELRAKLLAQRAALQEEARKKEGIHEEAKQATKTMVMLGYNFDDILEMADSEVSEDHLHLLFRSIGIYRKRRANKDTKPTPFGAARWLDRKDEFVIDLDAEADLAFSESEDEPEVAFPKKKESPVDQYNTLADGRHLRHGTLVAQARADTALQEASPDIPHFDGINEVDKTSKEASAEKDNSTRAEEIEEDEQLSQNSEEKLKAVEQLDDDTEMQDAGSELTEPDPHLMVTSVGEEEVDLTPKNSEEYERYLSSRESQEQEQDQDFVPDMTSTEAQIENKEQKLTETLDDLKSQAGAVPLSSLPHSSAPDNAPDENLVQQELEKVKAEIQRMQDLKLARSMKRDADLEMSKRHMELRDIASRRALLIQKRGRIDTKRLAQRVTDLERQLAAAKRKLDDTMGELRGIDVETVNLEKQELKLRDELSRPRIIVPQEEPSKMDVDGATAADIAEPEHETEEEPLVPLLTARNSPLCMFPSFRMCPSMGPLHWFSNSFNGYFVPNLTSRELCSNEMFSKKSKCTVKDCEHIHLHEFNVAPSRVCEYMATRQMDKPGFRDGLIEAIETHLAGPDVSVEQLAATIIGFCRKYDPSQILDWQGLKVERPF